MTALTKAQIAQICIEGEAGQGSAVHTMTEHAKTLDPKKRAGLDLCLYNVQRVLEALGADRLSHAPARAFTNVAEHMVDRITEALSADDARGLCLLICGASEVGSSYKYSRSSVQMLVRIGVDHKLYIEQAQRVSVYAKPKSDRIAETGTKQYAAAMAALKVRDRVVAVRSNRTAKAKEAAVVRAAAAAIATAQAVAA